MYKIYLRHPLSEWFKAHYGDRPITKDPTAGIILCKTANDVKTHFKELRRLYTVEELEVQVLEVTGG